MSITSVNPYASAYQTAATNNKQTNNLLDTVENTQAKATTRPGEDTVSISEEASQKSRAEQYALKDDPDLLFEEWLATAPEKAYLNFPEKREWDELLPENQTLINDLSGQASKELNEEKRRLIFDSISTIKMFGDKEIFTSLEDVGKRVQAESTAYSLKTAYMEEVHGVPSILDSANINQNLYTDIPRFSEVSGVDAEKSYENKDALSSLVKSSYAENLAAYVKQLELEKV